MSKTAVIFGGSGYIGSHVVKEFIKSGYDVTVFDNFSTGLIDNIEAFKDKLNIIAGDITEVSDLINLRARVPNPDVVVCLAALKHVDASMNPKGMTSYATVNINGTVNVLNYVALSGCKKFIFSSSAATFGSHDSNPIEVYDSQKPINFYGWTKLFTEMLAPWYEKVYGIKSVCLRYFNAAGYDNEHDIKGIETDTTNLIPVIMEVLFGKRDSMTIFGTDWNTRDGTCIRDYIHVTDLAKAHLLAAESNLEASRNCNLGTKHGTTVQEVIDAVKEIAPEYGLELAESKIIKGERRIGDPEALTADPNYANQLFGWKPEWSDIENIIHTTIQQYKKYYGTND